MLSTSRSSRSSAASSSGTAPTTATARSSNNDSWLLGRLFNFSFSYWRSKGGPETTHDVKSRLSSDRPRSALLTPSNVDMQIVSNDGILKRGYLTRKIWRFGRSTSYFVLRDDGKFYYYKNEAAAEDRKKYKGYANVKDVYIMPRGPKKFVVYTNKSIWYLEARTTEDREDWIEKLKFARACVRMKEEEELKRILNAPSSEQTKVHASEAISQLSKSIRIMCKNLQMLKVKLNDFRQSLPNGGELSKTQVADLDDTSRNVTTDIQSTLDAAERYLARTKNLQNEVNRMMHDLRFESEQRSNLLRQIELQAKQLKCIEKGSIRPKTKAVAEELSKLDDSILVVDATESEKEIAGGAGPISWHEEEESETGENDLSDQDATTARSKDRTPAAATPVITTRKKEGKPKSLHKSLIPSSVTLAKPEAISISRKPKRTIRQRRKQIPYRRKSGTSVWSFLQNAIGKELSRIPLPVDFNEPLSFIQRLTECLEYADLIDNAAKITEPAEQMIFVATFVISTLCNTPFRTCKPFNPMWCETFEFDRTEDLGWRAIAEQVSHHPPISAIHAEGNGWILDEDMCVHSNFQATAMKVFPEGMASILFPATKSFYYWTMKDIKTFVKGFIIGPITVHNEGDCIIISQPDGINCVFTLTRHSFFSSDNERSFSGKIYDKSGKELYHLGGDWSQKCVITQGNDMFKKGQVIWKRKIPPKGSELMYNYTAMAIELNEQEEGVAPTDSRLRPDMRMMENGDWDMANQEKGRLERKQRLDTKKYQDALEGGKKVFQRPIWFKKCFDRSSGTPRYIYQGQYWKCKEQQDWSRCPDIFGKEI